MNERHLAIHEAGHAVVQMRLCPTDVLGVLSIEADADTHGRLSSETRADDAEQASRAVMVLCGGWAALRAAGNDEAIAADGTGLDFEQASSLIDFWGLAPLEHWQRETLTLLSQPANRHAVETIARYALRHRRLIGDLLPVVLEYADGDCTEDDLRAFMARLAAP